MKKHLLWILVASSFGASASQYIGGELSLLSLSQGSTKLNFSEDNKKMDPDALKTAFGVYVGHQFNNNWALEIGYNQFTLDYESEYNLGMDGSYLQTREWDGKINAKQVSIASVYSHDFNKKWALKLKAGLMYSQYHTKMSSHDEKEDTFDVLPDINEYRYSSSVREYHLGALGAVGIDYKITKNFVIGGSTKYMYDNKMSHLMFNVMTEYKF